MMAGKPADQLVTAILDPNQAVEPRYIAYSATTTDGRAFAGVISSETGNSLTLKAPGGVEQTFLRHDLKELASLKRSLMPEGLEQAISPQQMADLLAYLNAPAAN
jgi:putative heme-binding domain-containing protein